MQKDGDGKGFTNFQQSAAQGIGYHLEKVQSGRPKLTMDLTVAGMSQFFASYACTQPVSLNTALQCYESLLNHVQNIFMD